MEIKRVVIDTNVLLTALSSRKGASYKLLKLTNSGKFQLNVSVALMLEYEYVLKREAEKLGLTYKDIEDFLDYLASIAIRRKIFFLWRPQLKDTKDDFILELAVAGRCDYIITYNKKHFKSIERFGVKVVTSKEFLKIIRELP